MNQQLSNRIPLIAFTTFSFAFIYGTYVKRQRNIRNQKQQWKKQRKEAIVTWDFSKLDATQKENEIVVFDLETTIPASDIIEFGAIVLDKFTFREKARYETLIYSSNISKKSIECNHITQDMVKESPLFPNVADQIFELLNGRIWVGHNIINFDIKIIESAFKSCGKQSPSSASVIDTLQLLNNSVGKRYGNLKLATLGKFFGLGEEDHRSVSDCEMNIQVLKNCALTMFLESMCNISLVPPKELLPVNNTKVRTSSTRSPSSKVYSRSKNSNSKIKNSPKMSPKPTHSNQNENVINNGGSNEQVKENNVDVIKIEELKDKLQKAMEEKQKISIVYHGGSTPGKQRYITPLRFHNKAGLYIAFCHNDDCEKSLNIAKTQIV